MSKTILSPIGGWIKPALFQEIEKTRGQIPRSRIVEWALMRFLDDVKNEKVSLLDGPAEVPRHTTARSEAAVEAATLHPPDGGGVIVNE